MYRHLLVPLDDSTLATELVRQAVLLAKALGAKVTFFHAQEDYGATSVAALERVMWPSLFNEHVAGEARAILAKAEVVAREAGVEHDSLTVTSDRPHEAILQAAEARGCDLIFIASHGRRGIASLMIGSQTQNVLQHTTLPVLVVAAESNLPDWEKIEALAILRDEHRSLAAVVHGLEFLAREAGTQGQPPRFDLLRAIVRYIEHSRRRCIIRRRTRTCSASCASGRPNSTRRSTSSSASTSRATSWSTSSSGASRLRGGSGRRTRAVRRGRQAIRRVAGAAHAARDPGHPSGGVQAPDPEDWKEIGKAFADNGDPRFSADTDEEFRQLFVRILNLVPEPTAAGPGIALRHPSHGRDRPTVVIVPGLRDHVPDHWQTLLGDQLPGSVTVPRMATDKLSCAAWVEQIERTLSAIAGPAILVAHSGGVMMVVHWAQQHRRPIQEHCSQRRRTSNPRCRRVTRRSKLCRRVAGCPCRARAFPSRASWPRAATIRWRATRASRSTPGTGAAAWWTSARSGT